MANERGRLKQAEFNRLDELYAQIPLKPIDPRVNCKWTVGTMSKGRVMKADVENCFHPTQRRVTITINDIWCLTMRFKIINKQWVAVPMLSKVDGKMVEIPALSWSRSQSFSDAKQFAQQYLSYRKTGKKQSGFLQQPSLPLFEVSV